MKEDHTTELTPQQLSGVAGGAGEKMGYYASCNCGWFGELWDTLEQAKAEGYAHKAQCPRCDSVTVTSLLR